ncbi:hypothetical protein OROMI_020099 [Orobanche minor]
MQDLKAEASFFDATTGESAASLMILKLHEGLVEIREDYVEEDSLKTSANSYKKTNSTPLKGNSKEAADEDEEYMRIQMRLDQLEKEEEAERAGRLDEDEQIQNEPDSTTKSKFY